MDIVFIETSIVSHATAWPSSDPATAVLQDQAKRWMDERAANYELVTSQIVLAEARRGDANAHVLPGVYRLLDDLGLPGLLNATPVEFLGGSDDEESNS